MPRYEGGCHCGALRFAIELRDDELDVLDCNCSICTKKGFLHLIVDEPRFTLLAAKMEADGFTPAAGISPAVYTFGTHTAKHMFCPRCGMHPFYRPRSHPNGWDVNVRCLDVPLSHWRIRAFDGANWEQNVESIR